MLLAAMTVTVQLPLTAKLLRVTLWHAQLVEQSVRKVTLVPETVGIAADFPAFTVNDELPVVSRVMVVPVTVEAEHDPVTVMSPVLVTVVVPVLVAFFTQTAPVLETESPVAPLL